MKNKNYHSAFLTISLLFWTVVALGTTPINGKYYLSQWSSPSLTNALSELNALNASVVLVIDQNYTMTAALGVDPEVALEFISGNIITSGSYVLAINGPISAGLYQVFSGTDVRFGNTGSVAEVYPQWWGAKVDGVTDDTDEINAAVNSFSTTSPPGYSGWGLGTIRLTKGNWLVNGTVERDGAFIGARFLGDGEYATTLITTEDDQVMFDLYCYISVEFANMTIRHDTESERGSWSNIVFRLDGNGGGRGLRLNHITTSKFGTVLKYHNIESGNQDTTYAEHCTFSHCNIFCDSLSTQGVINTYLNCTWTGAMTYGFYVAGSARTKILSGNVVIDGPFIYFRNVANKYSDSTLWLLENVKLEWTTAHSELNSAAKLIDGEDGAYVSYYIRLIGCALKGGPTPHAESLWARFNASRMRVSAVNSHFAGLVETTTKTSYSHGRNTYLEFKNCGISLPDTWVYDNSQVSGSAFPNMSFESCTNGLTPITNITIAKKGIPYIHPERRVVFSSTTSATPRIGFSGTAQHEMPSYGQQIEIKSVRLFISHRVGNEKTVYLYSDAARSNQIGTITIPSGTSGTDTIVDAILSAPTPILTSEGLYTSVVLDSTVYGYYIVEFGSR